MLAAIAFEWANALETWPSHKRGRGFLRYDESGIEYHSPLGVLASIVMPHTPKVAWYLNKQDHFWWLAPLVGKPSSTQLVEPIRHHCQLRDVDPAFNRGALPVSTLASHKMPWEHLAMLIRKHYLQL